MGNGIMSSVRSNKLYFLMLVLLGLLALVLYSFHNGVLNYEQSRVYLEAFSILATISLLYFAYVNVVSARTKDITAAELAVRPIFIWKILPIDKGKGAILSYKTIKHPLYNLDLKIHLPGHTFALSEHHLDVSPTAEQGNGNEKHADLSSFLRDAMRGKAMGNMIIEISYNSEMGGDYNSQFSKELKRTKAGYHFFDRKIIWSAYPWHSEKVSFD